MLRDLLNEAWGTLGKALTEKDHPFKHCSLGTQNEETGVRQRILILRGITASKNLLFYTDLRANKIKQLRENPKSSALFYDPKNKLQVIFNGLVSIHTDNELWESNRNKIDGNAVNNYNSFMPPGKPIKDPFTIKRTTKIHFGVLEFEPHRMEILKLRNDYNHLRARFRLVDEEWKKTYLVP